MKIEVYQQDWCPGFAAFLDDGSVQKGTAHVCLNVGALMAAVEAKDVEKADLPYLVAESLMHEVIHALEAWAGVEFSEEKVEALLEEYRVKYGKGVEVYDEEADHLEGQG
jgi:protein-disulfide isomerase-like protein with CxxC motif